MANESPPPTDPQQEPPRATAADRLLRAQAAELEALRSQMANLPDPDTLVQWRSKAEQFDSLAAELPAWREQLQSAHQQERQQLQQQIQQHEAHVAATTLDSELQREFMAAGGNPVHFSMWRELYGSKYAQRAEDGSMVSVENGQPMPLADVLKAQRRDPLYGVLYHPEYGSGSGARSTRDIRVQSTADIQKMSKTELFRSSFGSRRS
jgi:hypothetical protein